jgi:hypothetical protein
MRLGAQGEGAIVRSHYQVRARRLFPKQGGGEVNCVQCAEFGRHGLGGAGEDSGINLDQLQ